MKPLFAKINLIDDEKIILSKGIHWKKYVSSGIMLTIALAAILVISISGKPLIYLFCESAGIFKASEDLAQLLITLETAIYIALFLVFFFRLMNHLYTGYTITTFRVIKTKGWLWTDASQLQLTRCKSIDVQRDIIERLLNTGDITISSPETVIFMDDVPDAVDFAKTLQEEVTKIQTEDVRNL